MALEFSVFTLYSTPYDLQAKSIFNHQGLGFFILLDIFDIIPDGCPPASTSVDLVAMRTTASVVELLDKDSCKTLIQTVWC